jgi:hypothetical protein
LTDRNPVLNRIFEQFNIDRPADFTGRSISVSDVVVLQWGGQVSSHFVDSAGFVEIDGFLGEETKQETAVEASETAAEQTFSQVGKSSEPTVADLEADVKAGKSISVSDLAKAIKAANTGHEPPQAKCKPSILAQLEENKKLAMGNGRPDTRNHDDLEV